MRLYWVAIGLLVAVLSCSSANGDVGVILNESLDTSVARITGSGHSAVYLSRVCPASPVKLRLCRPGEQGSVMSNYTNLGEDKPFEWNIVPLSVFVYGVSNPANRPLFGSDKIKGLLEEDYRGKYIDVYCAGPPCTTSKNAEWREMVGAATSRSIYIFIVATTARQDMDLIAKFNALPNRNHFNAFTRNCANFTRGVINTDFPNAARPDYINDFGMTSPKAIARSFARYAHRHPDSQYRVLHFAQLPGTIKRSTVPRDGTEQLYRSKKLLVPMVLLAGHELPIAAASYLIMGRFDPQQEFAGHPTTRASELENEIKLAKSEDDGAQAEELKVAQSRERADVLGSSQEWAKYREEFNYLTSEAVREEIIPGRDYLNHVFKFLDEKGMPVFDDQGSLWMQVQGPGGTSQVGLSAGNILAQGSNPQLAYEVLLACIDHAFKSPSHSREIMPDFKETWALMQQARARTSSSVAMQPKP